VTNQNFITPKSSLYICLIKFFVVGEYFEFKQFVVRQDMCAMKVGTDSVLLGGWVNVSLEKRILDVGTGSGILALMLAQRTSAAIDAVELDTNAAEQARLNFSYSQWSSRLKSHCIAFQEFAMHSKQTYDLIISNPPYFTSGKRSDHKGKAHARHADLLPYFDLVRYSKRLLASKGRLALILPAGARKQIISVAVKNGLWLLREAYMLPKINMQSERILLEFCPEMPLKYSSEKIIVELEERHAYHSSFREYTKEFYLEEAMN
jgi:tRNA1Val (adenine37-N6)-methyltransferase